MNSARIAVLLPCLNEEATIAAVVADFRRALPEATVYICDNGSDDGTAEAARAAGATVVAEPRRGKGRAIRRLFREVEADIYVMADGDGTYDAESADDIVSTLQDRNLDMLVAARKRADAHAYTPLRRLGNRLFTALARWRCGPRVHDLLSGYRAFSRRLVERFPARSDGFEIETELTLFAGSSDLAWDEIECPYFARPEGSASKLKAFRDGFRILLTLLFSPPPASLETAASGLHSAPAAPAAARHTRRRLGTLRGATLIGTVTLAATLVFLTLNWLAVRSDPEPVADALLASYEHPERTLEDSAERFNDCLLSLMALDRGGSTFERTVSPRRVYRYTRPQRPCDALRQRLERGAVDDSDYLTVFYHQYWAGQRVMLQWL
ncbi:MAG: glycosyltransferase, partial [Acidobacteria bacterium]|nr:glycosyltransferase [Acidobacteriota bacterium]